MNHLEHTAFLDFIKEQFLKSNFLYINKQNNQINGFWFYGTDGIKIEICSLGQYVDFKFTKELINSSNRELSKSVGNVSLPFNACQKLLDLMFESYVFSDRNIQNQVSEEEMSYVKDKMILIKNFLKTATISLPNNCDDYIKCSLTIQDNHLEHILHIGSIVGYGKIITTSMIGVIEIPVTIMKQNKNSFYIKLMIPTWDIVQYPSLKSFMNHQYTSDSLDNLISQIQETSYEFGNLLHFHLLNHSIVDKKQKNTLGKKI